MKQRKNKPSAQEIAAIAGTSVQLVHRKLAQGKSPRQIIAEAEAQAQQAAQRQPVVNVTDVVNGHAASFAEAQRRKEMALAGLRETELAEKTGALVAAEQTRQWILHLYTPLIQSFRALPAEMRDLLTPGVSELLTRRVEGIIGSADRYIENCFQRGGKLMTDGALEVGDGYKIRWWIEAPSVTPPEVV